MKSPIKEFHVVFENCDCIKVPSDVVEDFYMAEVTESFSICSGAPGTMLHVSKTAGKAKLSINLNKAFELELGVDHFGALVPIHERIQRSCDVTHYYVYLEDGTEFCVRPPWEGDNQYRNDAQKHTSYEYENRGGLQQIFCVYHGFEFEEEGA